MGYSPKDHSESDANKHTSTMTLLNIITVITIAIIINCYENDGDDSDEDRWNHKENFVNSTLVCACSVVSYSFGTPWTVARQAPLSMIVFRQEYWSGLPFLLPGILLTLGLNTHLLGLLYCR